MYGQNHEEPAERPVKKSNNLPYWGNEKTMNLNPLILTNIQSSQYFKVNLYQLKTYHEVIDEIYYQVSHLEPWEKGSRKTSGQTGMCGGVRGVGAGGIVSTAFCILYKLYTLKLTRKQVLGLINHTDSAYIRGLGFMYIRFTQPPGDLWDWFEAYLDDEEEIDVRAGGGQTTTIGVVVRQMLTKLDWYCTLFPRIPVPIQKDIEKRMNAKNASQAPPPAPPVEPQRRAAKNGDSRGDRDTQRYSDREPEDRSRRDYNRDDRRERERDRDRRDRDKDRRRDYDRRDRYQREDRHRGKHDYADELRKERDRIKGSRRRSRSRSTSRDRHRRRH